MSDSRPESTEPGTVDLTLRFAADENFDGRIVRGLVRILPALDLVRVKHTAVAESDDDAVLVWAAQGVEWC